MDDRNALLTRIGTFFVLLGALLVIIFIASDVSRVDEGRIANSTQAYIEQGVQALQTRDAGAIVAKQNGQPTPTLAVPSPVNSSPFSYLPFFCLGTIIFGFGFFMRAKFSPPSSSGKRFEGIRKMQQKQREAKAKKEAPKNAPPKK
jgi:hypothetical protein